METTFSTEKLLSERAEQIRKNIAHVRERIAAAAARAGRKPEEITLVAVTKTMPASDVSAAVRCGVGVIGENRVQELITKLPDIEIGKAQVHLIGHLQTNKVKSVVDKVDMIQSLDSLHLATEIDRQAARVGRVIDVLVEVNIGTEESKSGVSPAELGNFLDALSPFSHIKIRGLMAVPPIASENDGNRAYFARMYKLFIDNAEKKSDNIDMKILSMGMSSDFETAIEEGSRMVRIGTAIFGKRTYLEG